MFNELSCALPSRLEFGVDPTEHLEKNQHAAMAVDLLGLPGFEEAFDASRTLTNGVAGIC